MGSIKRSGAGGPANHDGPARPHQDRDEENCQMNPRRQDEVRMVSDRMHAGRQKKHIEQLGRDAPEHCRAVITLQHQGDEKEFDGSEIPE